MSQATAKGLDTHTRSFSNGGNLEVPMPPLRFLLLEDNERFRVSLKESLEQEGHVVDAVEFSYEAGKLLSGYVYHVVIADIALHPQDIRGDEFILQHRELLDQAEVVAITGYGTNEVRVDELDEMGVSILTKGKHIKELLEITERRLAKRREELENHIQTIVNKENERRPFDMKLSKAPLGLLKLLEQVLLEWLRSREDPTKKGIIYGGRIYSSNELAEEVEKGTEVGQAHLKMLVDLFKFSVNLRNV